MLRVRREEGGRGGLTNGYAVCGMRAGIICFTFFKKAAKASKGARQNSIFGAPL
jgi:hypothetical protein